MNVLGRECKSNIRVFAHFRFVADVEICELQREVDGHNGMMPVIGMPFGDVK